MLMHILGIDTSTMAGSVALLADERVLVEYTLHTQVTHTERLLQTIEHVLNAATLSVDALDGIAVGIGPGSFTGLRIGVTTAKSLAYSLHTPLVGIPSLDALAAHYLFTEVLICALLDARKREVYTALYRNTSSQIRRVSDYAVVAPEAVCSTIAEPVVLVGEGSRAYRGQFEAGLGAHAYFADVAHNTPRGSLIAQLGYRRILSHDADDCFTLTPLYVRKSDAEIHWEQRHWNSQSSKSFSECVTR